MTDLPFVLTCRKDKGGTWYARIKTPTGYTPRKSTGTKDKSEAIMVALEWYKNGISKTATKKPRNNETLAIIDKLKRIDLSTQDVADMLETLKKRKLVLSYTLSTDNTTDTYDFLLNFWDANTSEYIKERIRKGHSLTKIYLKIMTSSVKLYWKQLAGTYLVAITKKDILDGMDNLDKEGLSNGRKNQIVAACLTPLRWAYNNNLIDHDITKSIPKYAKSGNKRQILSPEIAQNLFKTQWRSNTAKLANILAMCTGMRIGEIIAMKLQDLDNDCIHVRHSYNPIDKLKTPKNGEERTVYIPFPQIINALKQLGESNPYDNTPNAYIFYSTKPAHPMQESFFLQELRYQLKLLNIDNSEQYTFHAWRHFFATYMKDHITDKSLQEQTGHKTISMLEHYSSHRTQEDIDMLENTQVQIFGNIVNSAFTKE